MFNDDLSGREYADGVSDLFIALGCDPFAVSDIFNAAGGPSLAVEALGDTIVLLREMNGDFEHLNRMLPAPDRYMFLSRWEVENMFLDQGVTPPDARTSTGFFNKLRCMCVINRAIGWRIVFLEVDDPRVRMAFQLAA